MYPQVAQFDGEGAGLQPSAAVTADASASPVTAVNNAIGANRMAQASYGGGATKSPKPIDKSNWNKGIKVPQATVDAVKAVGKGNMGVNAATAAASTGSKYVGSQLMPNQPASPQYKEAVTRVYPNAYAKAANQAASGRTNSPYGFGGAQKPNVK